jgi:diadenylate cyclase
MFLLRLGFLDIGWLDLLDVVLVAVLLYQVYAIVRGSVASRVFLGYLLIYFLYLIVKALGLQLLTTILGGFISVGALALIIIFQQEIRRFLLLVGRSTNLVNNRYLRRWLRQTPDDPYADTLRPVLDACRTMADESRGGLLVLGRHDDLSKITTTGESIDARVSRALLLALFSPQSPLHDGAVVINGDRLVAARCILPVSDNEALPPALGFRHRAALGMSEATDAAIIAVSEETGRLSLAIDGNLTTGISLAELEQQLTAHQRVSA